MRLEEHDVGGIKLGFVSGESLNAACIDSFGNRRCAAWRSIIKPPEHRVDIFFMFACPQACIKSVNALARICEDLAGT